MNSLVKDALKLVIITVVAGLVLGAVYGITKKPIADQEAKAQMEAYKAVFPKASDFKDVDGFSEEAASKVIASYKNTVDGHESDVISSAVEAVDASGKALGYIFNITTSKGYGGDIQLTVGIQSDGTVSGYSVLSISETAGLGMKAKDDPSCRSCEERTHTWNDIIINSKTGKLVHLLSVCTENCRVSCMNTRCHLAFSLSLFHYFNNFL